MLPVQVHNSVFMQTCISEELGASTGNFLQTQIIRKYLLKASNKKTRI